MKKENKFDRSKIPPGYNPPMLPIMFKNMNYSTKALDHRLNQLKGGSKLRPCSAFGRKVRRSKSIILSRYHLKELNNSNHNQNKMVSLLYEIKRKTFLGNKIK
mmetsp:Transcript_23624/g.20991  ORF Transcript_23624/g.20991 Transcript_23624/m.20991 type:complete len:103 (-) Transcript_23624:264-572(-)